MPKWITQTYKIYSRESRQKDIEVKGRTHKHFGIHKEEGNSYYVISHLPTGAAILWVRKLRDAKACCKELEALNQWDSSDLADYTYLTHGSPKLKGILDKYRL